MNRSDHMQWCKDRANAILKDGDVQGAIASMMSDLGKNDDTAIPADSPLVFIGMKAAMGGDVAEADQFINGFN